MKLTAAPFLILSLLTFVPANASDMPKGFGPAPVLDAPEKSLIPTVNIAKALGWPNERARPIAAEGFTVTAFARNLDHPRWIYTLPNGDVLVAETNSPPKPNDNKGIKGFFMKKTMKKAGAGTESANRITLLRDTNDDGIADVRKAFLENLNSPFGMALIDSTFYVANSDGIVSFPYEDGTTEITTAPTEVVPLPGGDLNHHWTKSLMASKDGKHLYAGVGSNSNVGENGIDKEVNRAAILEIDPVAKTLRVYASGLRNPVGLSWQPESGALWTAVNERDELGNDLVPDYMTSVKDGGFYGWPYSYYGDHVDERVSPPRPDLVAKAIKPDYALGSHTASLGLTFYDADLFPAKYKNGAFIGQHGSWNREPASGYKVIFVPFKNGMPSGPPEDILSGFRNDRDEALGRPVGVEVDKKGALLVADDVGNIIWRVTPMR